MFLKNERGSALAMGVMFLALVGGGTYVLMQRSQSVTKSAGQDIKFLKGKVEAKKVFSMAGYLISNNLILCKSKSWGNGMDKNQCRWFGKKNEDTYQPEEFGLINLRYEKINNNKALTFDIKNSTDSKGDALTRYPGKVHFELVDVNSDNSLKEIIGDTPDDIKLLDKDSYVVKVTSSIQVPFGGDTSRNVSAASIFKRPLALPKVTFLNSSCLSQCDSLRGEHVFPACRGPFTIDGESTTDVIAITQNEGPGVIYDLQYEKRVSFVEEVTGAVTPPHTSVQVPLTDFLQAGETVEWVDKVKCATFVRNVTTYQTQTGNFFAGQTPGSTEVINQETTVSQHSEPAGTIRYILNSKEDKSRIEPFRLMRKVSNFEGDIGGKEELTETTVVIYVSPPH